MAKDVQGGWIGVDLDGTLAHYEGWKGAEHIGEPIPDMVKRVTAWLARGVEVRIFTARASVPEQVPPIHKWCLKHIGLVLPVTNVKDFGMVELWDDRCVQVVRNTGMPVQQMYVVPHGEIALEAEGLVKPGSVQIYPLVETEKQG